MSVGITRNGDECIISVSGVFDAKAASKLQVVLPSSTAPVNVVIDFSKAREITDTGLAALLETMRGSSAQVRARGLSHRHHRMLRLLSPERDRADGPDGR